MFDQLRASFRSMLDSARSPADHRAVAAEMKATLVQARMGLDDLRGGVAQTQERLATARAELETTRRRGRLAADIADRETVEVAARFEQQQAERVAVLERKLEAQEAELSLAEREVAGLTADYRRAAAGVPIGGAGGRAGDAAARAAAAEVDEIVGRGPGADALDALTRERARAEREASADERLAALKRRMGK